MNGMDLSHWNGDIDFCKVKKDFAILQTNHFTTKDNKFEDYYIGCKAHNIKVGAYIYCEALTTYDALLEVETCLEALRGKSLDLGVWLDIEDIDMAKLDTTELWEIINTEINALGDKFGGIYTNKNWYNNILKAKYYNPNIKYWMASLPYDDRGVMNEAFNPHTYMWQYSFKGKVDGISTDVDLDYIDEAYNKFIPDYVVGKDYRLLDVMRVRKGPGTNYNMVGHANLTADGKAHDSSKTGCLDKGTVITCLEVNEHDNEIWLRCPSGWICAKIGNEVYIK